MHSLGMILDSGDPSMNKRDKNQGKVVRRSQCGKLDLRIILVRVLGEKKEELNSLEFFVGWYLIVTN